MSEIPQLCGDVAEACRLYVDNLIKPLHSLGQLEDMAIRMAAITGNPRPKTVSKAIVIACGDTAVDGDNHTKGELSAAETRLVCQGGAPVSVLARDLGAPVYVIDVGLEKEVSDQAGLLVQKVCRGTRKTGGAMTEEAVKAAVSLGMSVAGTLSAQGVEAVGLGNIGERSMLSALSVTAAVMKEELQEASKQGGFQIHLSDVGDFATDPMGILAKVGSAEIAMLFGLVVGAARRGMMIVFDNAVTGAAVLAAVSVYPEIKNFIFPSVASDEPVHLMQMRRLSLKGFLHYDLTVAAGTGSALGLSLLDAALDMLNEMKTFGTANVAVAEDGPGKGRQREDVKG